MTRAVNPPPAGRGVRRPDQRPIARRSAHIRRGTLRHTSLRAHTLIGATTRANLARTIRRLITDARHPLHPLTPHVPLGRRKINRSAQTLEELVARLEAGDPVDVRDVAQVRQLLIGDRGELYDHPAADDLAPALHEAMRALEPSL